jgi:hypothetical protein
MAPSSPSASSRARRAANFATCCSTRRISTISSSKPSVIWGLLPGHQDTVLADGVTGDGDRRGDILQRQVSDPWQCCNIGLQHFSLGPRR